jgi:hypothetical protein
MAIRLSLANSPDTQMGNFKVRLNAGPPATPIRWPILASVYWEIYRRNHKGDHQNTSNLCFFINVHCPQLQFIEGIKSGSKPWKIYSSYTFSTIFLQWDIWISTSVKSVIVNQTFGSWKSIQFTPCLMSRSQILVRDMLATIRATIRFLSIIDQDWRSTIHAGYKMRLTPIRHLEK